MSMVQSPEWIWKSVTLFFTSFSHLKDSGLLENFHTNVVVEGEVAAGGGPPAVPPPSSIAPTKDIPSSGWPRCALFSRYMGQFHPGDLVHSPFGNITAAAVVECLPRHLRLFVSLALRRLIVLVISRPFPASGSSGCRTWFISRMRRMAPRPKEISAKPRCCRPRCCVESSDQACWSGTDSANTVRF